MKLPPSQSCGFSGWVIVPTFSQNFFTTSLFRNLKGISCTCTQKDTMFMSNALIGVVCSCLERTMMHLSKLYGSVARILSTSSLESKEKRMRCSPMNFIRKPLFDFHRGLNVFVMASRLIGRRVRNLAIMENSDMAWSEFRVRPKSSFPDRERDFQRLDRSSIDDLKGQKIILVNEVFPCNPRKKPTSLRIT